MTDWLGGKAPFFLSTLEVAWPAPGQTPPLREVGNDLPLSGVVKKGPARGCLRGALRGRATADMSSGMRCSAAPSAPHCAPNPRGYSWRKVRPYAVSGGKVGDVGGGLGTWASVGLWVAGCGGGGGHGGNGMGGVMGVLAPQHEGMSRAAQF